MAPGNPNASNEFTRETRNAPEPTEIFSAINECLTPKVDALDGYVDQWAHDPQASQYLIVYGMVKGLQQQITRLTRHRVGTT